VIFDCKRKVRTNNMGSRFVHLEKRWCLLNKVGKGSIVRLVYGGSALVIIPESSRFFDGEALEDFKKKLEEEW